MRSPSPRRLRRVYANLEYPLVILRFEDGHEIAVKRGEGREFDVFAGETVKVIVLWDPAAGDREVIAVRKGEEFEQAV